MLHIFMKLDERSNILSRNVENTKIKLLEIQTTVSGKKTTGMVLIAYQAIWRVRRTDKHEQIEIEMEKLRKWILTKKEEEEKTGVAKRRRKASSKVQR